MKSYIYQHFMLLAVVMTAFAVTLTSCSEDEVGMGTPEITAVRSCDPAKADSTFNKAGTGSIIAVIGKNLSKVQKAYINDQEVYFNPTMNTDHSVIITIPTEKDGFELTTFNSTLKDEIRLETTHGTAVYSFKITAPYPSISRIQGMYPREAGDVLNVFGLNLVDLERVYFTDIDAAQLDTTVWETIGGNQVDATKVETVLADHHINNKTQAYETNSQLSVTIPSLPYDKGTLVLQCAGGTTYIAFSKLPGAPILFSISSDMPVPGEVVTVKGRELVVVESVIFGDVVIPAEDLTVSPDEDEIKFVMPKAPSEGTNGMLTVKTKGGEGSIHFYDYNFLLTNFDGIGIDNGWDPNAKYLVADGEDAPYTSDGNYAHIFSVSEAQQWWGQMVYYRKDWDGNAFPLPSFDLIPADASADEVYLAMEIFNNYSDYNNGVFSGYLRYMIQPLDDSESIFDNFEWIDYPNTFRNFYPILGDLNDETPMDKWYMHVLPLSSFPCYEGKTYREIVETGLNQFRIQSINQGTFRGYIDVCIDNVRIYYQKK